MKRKRVLVGMSGGIDSSLAACLLKRKGYDVVGATMKLWPQEHCDRRYRDRACCSLDGIEDARRVAAKFGFPHYVFDFHAQFKKDVIDYFCAGYRSGATPNPCIMCNRQIKFDLFLKKAEELDCDYIATGHYAKVGYRKSTGRYFIKEGWDKKKDQSYFLSFVSQRGLSKALFPLGGMTKAEARRKARALGVKTHDKRSSQEICFVPDHYAEYLKRQGVDGLREGDVLDTKGKKMGRHKGIHLYTIGQRKGLGIAHKEPLYVIAKDHARNTVTIGIKSELKKNGIIVSSPCWGPVEGIEGTVRVLVRIRYGRRKAKAVLEKLGNGSFRVIFCEPQEAPAPGQAAVFYRNGAVLGGAWIDSVIEDEIRKTQQA